MQCDTKHVEKFSISLDKLRTRYQLARIRFTKHGFVYQLIENSNLYV